MCHHMPYQSYMVAERVLKATRTQQRIGRRNMVEFVKDSAPQIQEQIVETVNRHEKHRTAGDETEETW